MKKVITYGTYDLFHQGHENLLKKAKALGDYLIVGVTSDRFDKDRGKLNVRDNVLDRVQAVKDSGYADQVIIEDYEGQKIDDILKYDVDVFAIGSDWQGKFDYLKEYCEVVYLPRTQGISSSKLREECDPHIRMGIIGTGRIARRFVPECDFVSGLEVTAAYNPHRASAEAFGKDLGISLATDNLDDFFGHVDAVYIASPHLSHYQYALAALQHGKHVMCEIPFVLKASEAEQLYALAKSKGLVMMEASKTAHLPAWNRLLVLLKSGIIGEIVDVKASLSKLMPEHLREFDEEQAGGSVTELAPFPLMSIIKILGTDYDNVHFYSKMKNGVDIFTSAHFSYPSAVASVTLGLGVKTEGNLVISGTKGYVLVPSPWWLTNYFEVNFEDRNRNKKYFYAYEGDGLRYETLEFMSMIVNGRNISHRLTEKESVAIARIIEQYRNNKNTTFLK